MKLNQELLILLRSNVESGVYVDELVELIKFQIGHGSCSTLTVMYYFMQAFNLSYSQVQEMPGALCLGGGVYSNDEINTLISQYIYQAN